MHLTEWYWSSHVNNAAYAAHFIGTSEINEYLNDGVQSARVCMSAQLEFVFTKYHPCTKSPIVFTYYYNNRSHLKRKQKIQP